MANWKARLPRLTMASQMHLHRRMLNLAKILLPTDFSARSKIAAQEVGLLARRLHSEVTLLHVNNGVSPAHSWREEAHTEARDRLHALLTQAGVCADKLVVRGDAPKALCAAVQQKEGALLVIGRRPVPGKKGRLGSDAYGIICHSACPVVSI